MSEFLARCCRSFLSKREYGAPCHSVRSGDPNPNSLTHLCSGDPSPSPSPNPNPNPNPNLLTSPSPSPNPSLPLSQEEEEAVLDSYESLGYHLRQFGKGEKVP